MVSTLSTIRNPYSQDRIYYTEIKIHLSSLNGRGRVEKVLILLLESGVIYCTVWVSMNTNFCMSTLNGIDCVSGAPDQGICDLTDLGLR